ncbi:MAG: TIM barrel protein, partial [Candidatus Omnitrophota bacterium]
MKNVFVGMESGSNSQLKRYGKGVSSEEHRKALRILENLGIQIGIGFIPLDPMVTIDELEENVDFLVDTGLQYAVAHLVHQVRVFPGTGLYKMLKNKKLLDGTYDPDWLVCGYHYQNADVAEILLILRKWEVGGYQLHNEFKLMMCFLDDKKLSRQAQEKILEYSEGIRILAIKLLKKLIVSRKGGRDNDDEVIRAVEIDLFGYYKALFADIEQGLFGDKNDRVRAIALTGIIKYIILFYTKKHSFSETDISARLPFINERWVRETLELLGKGGEINKEEGGGFRISDKFKVYYIYNIDYPKYAQYHFSAQRILFLSERYEGLETLVAKLSGSIRVPYYRFSDVDKGEASFLTYGNINDPALPEFLRDASLQPSVAVYLSIDNDSKGMKKASPGRIGNIPLLTVDADDYPDGVFLSAVKALRDFERQKDGGANDKWGFIPLVGLNNVQNTESIRRGLQTAREYSCRAYEAVFKNEMPFGLDEETKVELKNFARAGRCVLTVHAPMVDILKDNANIQLIRNSIICASGIGAKIVTMHLSHPGREFALKARPLFVYAMDIGVILSIENTAYIDNDGMLIWHNPAEINETFNSIFEELDAGMESCVGFTFDTGHARERGGERLPGFLEKLDGRIRIVEVHLHGNRYSGEKKIHISPLADKEMRKDLEGILRYLYVKRCFDGPVILEYPLSAEERGFEMRIINNIIEDQMKAAGIREKRNDGGKASYGTNIDGIPDVLALFLAFLASGGRECGPPDTVINGFLPSSRFFFLPICYFFGMMTSGIMAVSAYTEGSRDPRVNTLVRISLRGSTMLQDGGGREDQMIRPAPLLLGRIYNA